MEIERLNIIKKQLEEVILKNVNKCSQNGTPAVKTIKEIEVFLKIK